MSSVDKARKVIDNLDKIGGLWYREIMGEYTVDGMVNNPQERTELKELMTNLILTGSEVIGLLRDIDNSKGKAK